MLQNGILNLFGHCIRTSEQPQWREQNKEKPAWITPATSPEAANGLPSVFREETSFLVRGDKTAYFRYGTSVTGSKIAAVQEFREPGLSENQWLPARKRSASSAAMQPIPAAVTAWRKILSLTSPAAKTPGTLVLVESGAVRI